MLLCAPSEPKALRDLGVTASSCEENGVDFMWLDHEGSWCGAQRKAVVDLVASIRGDRLARELGQAEHLAHRFLIVEGDWRWRDGASQRLRGFTRKQYNGMIVSIQVVYGWHVIQTGSLPETAELLEQLQAWFSKARHGSLSVRPKPRDAVEPARWGESRHRATQLHIMQSFDGWGVVNAAAAVDHFGKVPLSLSCSEAELRAVPGVGPKRAQAVVDALG